MRHPLLYEINTRCWLRELSDRSGNIITLANVPDTELASWRRLGFTHAWLMGVWQYGPLARAEALRWPEQRQAYSEALPDWTEEDVVASPYAIAAYDVASNLGGESGLAVFRRKLNDAGIKLLLDFVPNHLGLDHPWIYERPDLFVQAPKELSLTAGLFTRETRLGARTFAHGKDPNFPAWSDTIQLDYRRTETRVSMLEVLHSIADRCDGVRCDMAMLVLPDVFAQTWSGLPTPASIALEGRKTVPANVQPAEGGTSDAGFWRDAISSVKSRHPEFLFLAEAYWGLEPRLQAEGFDFTYDKELYDRLVARDAAGTQRHVLKQLAVQGQGGPGQGEPTLSRGAHFLENHDERRIASILSPAEHRAAALVILGLPGMRFLHEGQLTGASPRLPVQLNRRCLEPTVPEVARIYNELLAVIRRSSIGSGRFRVLQPQRAWESNPTHENFVIVQWLGVGPSFDLVVVNLAAHQGQCIARLDAPELGTHNWRIQSALSAETFSRDGGDVAANGLFLDVPALGAQILQFRVQPS